MTMERSAPKKRKSAEPGAARVRYNARRREHMRVVRADPKRRALERLAENLKNEVVREMILRHKDEFRTLLNERRVEHGMKPVKFRRKMADPTDALRIRQAKEKVPDPVPERQAKCPHNQGLTKLSYGTFCSECGKRIR